MADSPGEVTVLLGELKRGRKDALQRLIPLVYRELRRVAGRCMRDERPGHTLQPTALVHEAFLRDWAMAKAWMKTQLEMGGSR